MPSLMPNRPGRRLQGGYIGLLLSLLAIGAVLYFVLRGGLGGETARADTPLNCQRAIAPLMAATGGIGPAYAEGYAKLPSACQRLIPAPGALEPSPQREPDAS